MERGRCLGAEAALRRSGEDTRYPLSVAEPLHVLREEYRHSDNHLRKVENLTGSGYSHRRRVRGDGNCFYRAACFAWLEALVARAARGEAVDMPLPGGWPEASLFGALAEEYRYLRSAIDRLRQGARVGQELLARLLIDVRLDLCAVALLRLVAADFLAQFSDPSPKSGGGDGFGKLLRAAVAEKVSEHGSIESYVRAEVLPLGQEAEGAGIFAAAVQLGVRMRILQLDGQEGPVRQYVYPCEDYEGPLGIRIHLLFKPGHYEVLYLQEATPFTWSAKLRGRCSFCHEEADLDAVGLLPCFHRLCFGCSLQASRCPNCVEFLPDSALAPTASGGLSSGAQDSGAARSAAGSALGPPRTLSPTSAAAACAEARQRLEAAATDADPGLVGRAPQPAPASAAPTPPVAAAQPPRAPAAVAAPRATAEPAAAVAEVTSPEGVRLEFEEAAKVRAEPADAAAPTPAAAQPPLACLEEIPQAHGGSVTAIAAVGADRFYTASLDGSLFRWRVTAGTAPGGSDGRSTLLLEDFRLSLGSPCRSLAFAGGWLFCGLDDGRILALSETGAEVVLRGLAGHSRCVAALLAYDERWLASGGEDGSVRFWVRQGEPPACSFEPRRSEELGDAVVCFARLDAGLLVGTAAGLVLLAGVAGEAGLGAGEAGAGAAVAGPSSRQPLRPLGPRAPVAALAPLSSGGAAAEVAAVYEDGSIQTYRSDGSAAHALSPLQYPPGDVLCAAWAPFLGRSLLLAHAGGELSARSLAAEDEVEGRQGSTPCRLTGGGSAAACLAAIGKPGAEAFLLAGTAGGGLQLWARP